MSLDLVDELLNNEKPKNKAAPVKQYNALKYVTTEEFEKLGKPKFGYTTARIAQFEKDTKEWEDVFCEYIIEAIKFVKLNWYLEGYDWEGNIDEKLNSAKLEIAEFRRRENLSVGDFYWVEQIAYEENYSRNALIGRIKRHNSKAIIPPKQKYNCKYLKWAAPPVEIEEVNEEELSLGDIVDNLFEGKPIKKAIPKIKGGCEKHPEFKGLRLRTSNKCQGCIDFYNKNKKDGIKESRG